MKKILLYGIFVVFFLALFYVVYYFYILGNTISVGGKVKNIDKVIAEKLLNEADVNLSSKDISEGFWYLKTGLDGEDSITFFDTQSLIDEEMDEENIDNLIADVKGSDTVSRNNIKVLTADELPEDLAFHNALYAGIAEANFLEIKNILINKNNKTKEEWKKLAYVYELAGEYKKRDEIEAVICKKYNTICRTQKINIFGMVFDQSGKGLNGVKIEIVSIPTATPVFTTSNGSFLLKDISVNDLEKLRFQVGKEGYVDNIFSKTLIKNNKPEIDLGKLYLNHREVSEFVINIDSKKIECVSDNGVECLYNTKKKSYKLTTSQATYQIPHNAFYLDGKKYTGIVKAYLYFFDARSVPDELISLDVFDSSGGFSGTSMVSFGMPYTQFFTADHERIDVLSSNPMQITMQMLYNDYLSEKVSEEQINVLLKQSAGGKLITQEFLRDNFIIEFPAFWVLDRLSGIWSNVGMKLLDRKGNIESVFYTIKGN